MVDFFKKSKDGGPDSNVTGYWLIEWKRYFSVALLCFEDGTREAFHSHAFNCVSWVLSGKLVEWRKWPGCMRRSEFLPSLKPVITTRDNLHRVFSVGRTWVLTFRGPWCDYWHAVLPEGQRVTLTHGRKVVKHG